MSPRRLFGPRPAPSGRRKVPVSDLQLQINQRIAAFVAEITDLARRQALATMATALGERGPARGRRGGAALAASTRSRAKGEKRPASEIAALVDRMAAAVAAEPGLRIEQIGRQLEMPTKELVLPVRKLIADGAIRTEGARRATRYFPADGTKPRAGKRRRARA
jgi:hypothetical protein